ncbi:MAG: hypothetical protein WBL21_02880 [Salinimicrobium sp.]
MRKLITILAAIFVLQSCNSLYFTSSQPQDGSVLKQFPNHLLGSFASETEDTLVVKSTSFIFRGGEAVNLSGDITPKGCVLKQIDDWYIISLQDGEEWEVFPVKVTGKDNFTVYFMDLEENEEKRVITGLKKKMEVQKIFAEDGSFDHYLINPSSSQFIEMLKDNLFTEEMDFERIK